MKTIILAFVLLACSLKGQAQFPTSDPQFKIKWGDEFNFNIGGTAPKSIQLQYLNRFWNITIKNEHTVSNYGDHFTDGPNIEVSGGNLKISLTKRTTPLTYFVYKDCNENDIWPHNYEGTYQLDVTVSQRPPEFGIDMNPIFPTQALFGVHFDLTQNVCCEPKPPSYQHGCPWEYSRNDFEIFKHDEQYFLKNSILHDADGNQLTFHIPLIKEKKKLYMPTPTHNPNRKMLFVRDVGLWGPLSFPSECVLLELEFHINGTQIIGGKWKYIDYLGQPCYLKKNGELYGYRMAEFATFKAKKIK